jgi:hypothetical protein
MKKNIFVRLSLIAAVVVMSVSLDACQNTCKFCKTVTYDNGSFVSETAETEYCGTALITKEATPDITVGTLVTKVECR